MLCHGTDSDMVWRLTVRSCKCCNFSYVPCVWGDGQWPGLYCCKDQGIREQNLKFTWYPGYLCTGLSTGQHSNRAQLAGLGWDPLTPLVCQPPGGISRVSLSSLFVLLPHFYMCFTLEKNLAYRLPVENISLDLCIYWYSRSTENLI